MKISQKTIDEIFNTAVIEDVISEFVALKKTGANYKGLSPFNDEKTPSFVVSPAKEIWKDFSSGKGGNVISFLIEHEQYTYPEALLFLAKKYNIHVEYLETDFKNQEQENEKQATLLVLNFVKDFFVKTMLNKGSEVLEYLNARGFSKSTIELFEIGYCDKLNNDLVLETKKAGYNIEYLHKTRIINKEERSRFSGRIIFPIHSMSGDVLGFGARVFSQSTKSAKYLNSDSSDFYQKSKILYGMHLAKKEIKKLDFCYVVEGYTDVIALFQFGIKNVVSSCGTALTQDQIRLMHRFTKNIGILFDSDNAGVNATLKAIDEVLKAGMNPKILQLPQGEDPSSFLQKENKETVHDYIQKNTINFIDFKYQLIDTEDTAALINTTKSIIHSISLINDSISQSFHIKETAKKLSLNELDLLKELQNQNKAHLQANIKKQKTVLSKDDSVNKLNFELISRKYLEELQLIRLLINYGSTQQIIINDSKITVAEFIVLELEKDSKDINSTFSVPLFNKILNEIKNKINLKESVSQDYFINHANLEFRAVSSYVIGEKHLLGNWEDKDIIVIQEEDILAKVTTESILRFKLKRVQEILKELLIKLKNESLDHQSIIKQFSKLSKVEKKIQQKLGRIF